MAPRVVLIAAVCMVLVGCAGRVPVAPGEIPPGSYVTAEDEEYGQEVLSVLTRSYPLSHDDAAINRVRDIVDRLADAAGAGDAPWNVYVLQGDEVINAAATRGHFMFVWSGMLRLVKNDGELAAVLAHEMGHVLADHTSPSPAEEAGHIMASIGGNVANQVVSMQGPYGALAGLAGLVAEEAIKAFVVNPESQRKEFEADHIGLFLMADARYDPREALTLWSVMNREGAGPQIPALLSSHPANDDRLLELEQLLPEAMKRYHTARSLEPEAAQGVKRSTPRKPQFEPDSFTFGRDKKITDQAGRWLALEDGVTIFSSPNTRSQPLARLKRNEALSVGYRSKGWFEVLEPVQGYVLSAEVYPERP